MDKKRLRTNSVDAAIVVVISNNDLLFEIFLRLPALSLVRFKLVSKGWLSLILHPEFGIAHSRRIISKSPVSHLYYGGCKKNASISFHNCPSFPTMTCLDRDQVKDGLKVVNSCNGLILIEKIFDFKLVVLNPTTQKYNQLMVPVDHKSGISSYYDCLLAFEPLRSHHYKVVVILFTHEPIRILIFSSQSETWKELPITERSGDCCTRKIYSNRLIHWLNKGNLLVEFDVDAEKFIKTPLPPKPRILGYEKHVYFGESNGRLFLIQCHREGAPGFKMLELDVNTHSWSVKHQINLRPLVLQFPDICNPT